MQKSSQQKLTKEILNLAKSITAILKKALGNNLISSCLFGSSVTGLIKRGSDIDILLVLNSLPNSYHKRTKMILPFLERIRETNQYITIERLNLNIEPSFLILSAHEIEKHPAILIDISQEGIILFDKNDFLKIQLDDIKDKLQKSGAVKKHVPEGYYWVLKPGIKAGELFEL